MSRFGRLGVAVSAAFEALRGRAAPDEGGSPGTATTSPPNGGSPAAGPPVSAFQREDEQYLTAIKWLVGALAAIAAVLVAGTQLSSLGQLSWSDNRDRLVVATVAFALVLACVVVALGLLAWVQMPGRGSDLERLRNIADKGRPQDVLDAVEHDSSYHRGTGCLADLLIALEAASAEHYRAKADLTLARLAAAGEAQEGRSPTPSVKQATERADARSDRYRTLREGARRVSQLDRHLLIARRAKGVLAGVLFLTLVSALALGAFTWAAYPPAEPAVEEDAVAARPVTAFLLLASADQTWDDRLGESCAAAARTEAGVPAVALSASDDGIEVLVLAQGNCPEPRVVVVGTDQGTVIADESVETSP